MEKLLVENARVRIEGTTGIIVVTIDGKEEDLCELGDISALNSTEIHDFMLQMLEANSISIAPQQPKVKRPYHKRVNLGLASDFGKVTLKLAEPEKIAVFKLKLKSNGEYVWKIDERGIYTSNAKTSKPLWFTQNDIKRIRNIDDFIVEKDYAKKVVKDKLA